MHEMQSARQKTLHKKIETKNQFRSNEPSDRGFFSPCVQLHECVCLCGLFTTEERARTIWSGEHTKSLVLKELDVDSSFFAAEFMFIHLP